MIFVRDGYIPFLVDNQVGLLAGVPHVREGGIYQHNLHRTLLRSLHSEVFVPFPPRTYASRYIRSHAYYT